MQIRLQKFLASAGVASRRKAEEIILSGRVTVNSQTVSELGFKIDENKDVVALDGKVLGQINEYTYVMLHKPKGYITTVKDQFDRPTVMDFLEGINRRLIPVGRLDYDTSGLLLLTDDGDLTYKLTHPKHQIPKVYDAWLAGVPEKESLEKFRKGVLIDGYLTAPAKIQVLFKDKARVQARITVTEGKNRQVRKMCEAIKHPVINLKRVAVGMLELGDLKLGDYRVLNQKEIDYLKSL